MKRALGGRLCRTECEEYALLAFWAGTRPKRRKMRPQRAA